ncbi:MAG: hypothetical protein GY710_05755 [Desulfobacteraceae bacterium]|nr:hypothetical protein [Desulfobacteraceae bacterium]
MSTLPEELDLISMPKLFTNEHIPIEERTIKMHLFSYEADWFFCEYDSFVKNLFGMVIKNGNFENAK